MTEKTEEKVVSDNLDTGNEPTTPPANPLGVLPQPAPELEFHEYANIFPMFSDGDFNDLVDSIKAGGLEEKITLLGGKVLDGRNRYRALRELGWDVAQHCEEYCGDDPSGFVIRKNLHRRHLDESQRSMVAARLANIGHGGHRKHQVANLPLDHASPITQAEAAEMLNVGKRSVGDAKVVLDSNNDEAIKAVESGEEAVSAAANKIRADKKSQRKDKPVTVKPPKSPQRRAASCVHDKPNACELVPKAREAVEKIDAPKRDELKLSRKCSKVQEAIAQKILEGGAATVAEAMSAILAELSDDELAQWSRLANKEGRSNTDIAFERRFRKLKGTGFGFNKNLEVDTFRDKFCKEQFRLIDEARQRMMATMEKMYTSFLDSFCWDVGYAKARLEYLLNLEIERSQKHTTQLETLRDEFMPEDKTSTPGSGSDNPLNSGDSDSTSKKDVPFPIVVQDGEKLPEPEIVLKASPSESGTEMVETARCVEGETYFNLWNAVWQKLGEQPNTPFKDAKPQKKNYMRHASDHHGISYYFTIGHSTTDVMLYINRGRKENTNLLFDKLHQRKDEIEERFGKPLEWKPAGRSATIKYILHNRTINSLNESDLDERIDCFIENIPRFEAVMREALNEVLVNEPATNDSAVEKNIVWDTNLDSTRQNEEGEFDL